MAGKKASGIKQGENQSGVRNDGADGHAGGSKDSVGLDLNKLESAICGHVVGHLLKSHGNDDAPASGEASVEDLFGGLREREVIEAFLSDDPGPFYRLLDAALDRQNRLKHVCSHIVTPVADELGQMWKDDRASFSQVSMACARLSVMIQQVAASRRPEKPGERDRSILFARMPGADHTIGLSVVSACFREAGWDVDGGTDLCFDEEVMVRLKQRRYSVFGVSVGRAQELAGVAKGFEKVRRKLANRRPIFGIGGPVVATGSAKEGSAIADFCASDAWEALSMAEARLD